MGMKVQIKKDVLVEATDGKTGELYDLQLKKWDMLHVEKIAVGTDKRANITTYDGNSWWDVPVDAFETV